MAEGKELKEEVGGTPTQEVDVAIDKVKMQEHEALRIVITKTVDSELSILVKSGGEIKDVSFFEVMGVLETAKNDMMNQQNGGQQPTEAPGGQMQMETIILTSEDFELDADGRLAASGKKVGDAIQIPAPIVELRDNAIANLRRQKGETPEGTKMTIVPKAGEESKDASEESEG